ncbi:hypothetical protein BC831DRAFT_554507 [Entophlyctis helioformis]|nr:hypothetical protein BC831DRAFT_554507 [Entophlyctis helioformis]
MSTGGPTVAVAQSVAEAAGMSSSSSSSSGGTAAGSSTAAAAAASQTTPRSEMPVDASIVAAATAAVAQPPAAPSPAASLSPAVPAAAADPSGPAAVPAQTPSSVASAGASGTAGAADAPQQQQQQQPAPPAPESGASAASAPLSSVHNNAAVAAIVAAASAALTPPQHSSSRGNLPPALLSPVSAPLLHASLAPPSSSPSSSSSSSSSAEHLASPGAAPLARSVSRNRSNTVGQRPGSSTAAATAASASASAASPASSSAALNHPAGAALHSVPETKSLPSLSSASLPSPTAAVTGVKPIMSSNSNSNGSGAPTIMLTPSGSASSGISASTSSSSLGSSSIASPSISPSPSIGGTRSSLLVASGGGGAMHARTDSYRADNGSSAAQGGYIPGTSPGSSPANANADTSSLLESRVGLPLSDAVSFAYFRRTDIHPKRERHILYALHVKQSEGTNLGVIAADEMSFDPDKNKKAAERKEKVSKRSAALSKLNALLRPKKKKKTRAGMMHCLMLAIHDRRVGYSCALINELSPNSLKKKRMHESNKVFLYALANRLEPVCLLLMDKGFPFNINAPIFGASTLDPTKFIFPSYFILAVAFGLDNLIKAMLKLRPNLNASWYRITPLVLAACKGNLQTVQLLFENGANPSVPLPLSYYFLLRSLKTHGGRHFSADPVASTTRQQRNSVMRVEPVNASDFSSGFKQYGDKQPVRFSPEFIAEKALLPLELAALSGHKEVVKYLLPRTDPRALAACHFMFLVQHDVEVTLYLIKCGANMMQRDSSGSTALHLAARAGKLDQIIAMVLSKVDVNARGQNDWTALHEAVSFCRKDVVQYLLKKGADRNAKTSNTSETPMDVARRMGFSEDEMTIYFDRLVDEAFIKRKEDSISSMMKIIQVTEPSKSSAGILASGSSAVSAAAGAMMGQGSSSKDGRKTSKSAATGPAGASGDTPAKRKGSDKFGGFPFLSRGSSASSSSAAAAAATAAVNGSAGVASSSSTGSGDILSNSSLAGTTGSTNSMTAVVETNGVDAGDGSTSPKLGSKSGKRKLFGGKSKDSKS